MRPIVNTVIILRSPSGGGIIAAPYTEPPRAPAPPRPLRGFIMISRNRFRVGQPAQRAGGREHLACLKQRLETGEDHRPAAVKLSIGVLAQLIVGDDQPA